MTHRWLVLQFDAPLMAFGGVAVDQVGPVRDFPAASMLTGLIGNALGWHWSETTALQSIQDRMIFGARREREGTLLTDTQNAQLAKTDKGWTTRGVVEGRAGASYGAPHRRLRDYHADQSVRIVLRLDPAGDTPALDALAEAIGRPARPLFFGTQAVPARGAAIGQGAELLGQRRYRSRGASYGTRRRPSSPRPVARGTGAGDGRRRGPDRRPGRSAELAHRPAWRITPSGGGPD